MLNTRFLHKAPAESTKMDRALLILRVRMLVEAGEATKQKDDLIYFTTPYPFKFDRARVSIKFSNPNPDQQIELGFKDREIWHYDTQVADMPFMHQGEWNPVGSGPTLYQKSA